MGERPRRRQSRAAIPRYGTPLLPFARPSASRSFCEQNVPVGVSCDRQSFCSRRKKERRSLSDEARGRPSGELLKPRDEPRREAEQCYPSGGSQPLPLLSLVTTLLSRSPITTVLSRMAQPLPSLSRVTAPAVSLRGPCPCRLPRGSLPLPSPSRVAGPPPASQPRPLSLLQALGGASGAMTLGARFAGAIGPLHRRLARSSSGENHLFPPTSQDPAHVSGSRPPRLPWEAPRCSRRPQPSPPPPETPSRSQSPDASELSFLSLSSSFWSYSYRCTHSTASYYSCSALIFIILPLHPFFVLCIYLPSFSLCPSLSFSHFLSSALSLIFIILLLHPSLSSFLFNNLLSASASFSYCTSPPPLLLPQHFPSSFFSFSSSPIFIILPFLLFSLITHLHHSSSSPIFFHLPRHPSFSSFLFNSLHHSSSVSFSSCTPYPPSPSPSPSTNPLAPETQYVSSNCMSLESSSQ
ncbi:hypothetical protein C7M84_025116 [Penaeus vannamei]|uniref:Uncharacterized protein n=1 Tax=Penaeus vannamei TaxID=6689 RepID=A0A3R7NAD4_PENVA|nr:hypothetical protein C7M84_025116 [Penaeus vannamei]